MSPTTLNISLIAFCWLIGIFMGIIGFLAGSLITNLSLRPKVLINERVLAQHDKQIEDIYEKINEIYKAVVIKS